RGAGAASGRHTAEITGATAPASAGTGGLGEVAPDTSDDLGGGGLGGGLGDGVGAPIGNVPINIESVNAINPLSRLYHVSGQIIGHGVRRAGIYVDGRLVKRLPASPAANSSN